jgi:hypothetical protein
VVVAVLAELWRFENVSKIYIYIWRFLDTDTDAVAVAYRVAVAGWQWYRWIEEIRAVRMVPVSTCGCGCVGGWVAVKVRM